MGQAGGGILWDYRVSSVAVYTDNSAVLSAIEIACMALLGLNILSEFAGQFTSTIQYLFPFSPSPVIFIHLSLPSPHFQSDLLSIVRFLSPIADFFHVGMQIF